MSRASWNLCVSSARSRCRSSVKKRRAAKSKSPTLRGPSESAKASSNNSSISPRSLCLLPLPLPPPFPPLSPRSLSKPLSPRSLSPNAEPNLSEPPRSIGPSPLSLSLPPPLLPFSPLFPAWARRTTRFLPSSGEPCKPRAFWAWSTVAKVTKQTPFELPSGFRKTFRRSTSPTSSKNDLISSSGKSPTFATNTCFGSASRGSRSPFSPFFPFPLPLPLPPPPPPKPPPNRSSSPIPPSELPSKSISLPPPKKSKSKSEEAFLGPPPLKPPKSSKEPPGA
mmetsp:Transcript_7813/g.19836  ORF Transcript_7813/g.19836 Transcript_7813/m.19836 type:complete len:280 (-) Transcript_7813:805-1644(-)